MPSDTMLVVAIGLPETEKLQLKSKLAPLSVSFLVPRGMEELRQLVGSQGIRIGCVLLDGDTMSDGGLAPCAAVRSVNKTVPVLVMSSEQDRKYYMKAIRWGVSGFLIKPLNEEAVRAKFLDCYSAQGEQRADSITLDLEKFLFGEFRKAEKGHFSLTFLFATVQTDGTGGSGRGETRTQCLNRFYDTIRPLFWDTDAFIRYNPRYCLGVYPFCGRKEVATLEQKMRNAFDRLAASSPMPANARLVTAYSCYPDDSSRFLDLQKILADKVRLQMGDGTLDWFV